jgi:hypothetical protein
MCFDDARLVRIKRFEPANRLVDRQNTIRGVRGHRQRVIGGDQDAVTLGRPAMASRVDKYVPHFSDNYVPEMRRAFVPDPGRRRYADPRLVNQRSGRNRSERIIPPHGRRDGSQLVVRDPDEFINGRA